MSKQQRSNLYKEVVGVAYDYLGPAAPRFIDRQIQNHLSKVPAELRPSDMPTLITWSKSALALLTDDREIITEFTARLNALTASNRRIPNTSPK